MSEAHKETASFARFIEALRPALPMVVVIGGWAHRLYRLLPDAMVQPGSPLMTHDADIAIDPALASEGFSIGANLAEAGFAPEPTGDAVPPVTRYRAGDKTGFYAGFVTPFQGSDNKRSGIPDITAGIAGVSAQKLRYLDLLLEAPWTVHLESNDE